ncbi:MAG TPA: hypothetical protein VFI49_02635 [Rudaea sp.]|nr:hypothetical protein [Rudaea sp.]
MIPFAHDRDRALAGAARTAAARIGAWLLSPQVQLREGVHAGAIAGAMDSAGRARYVYPEITGYYLHWLAEAHLCQSRDDLGVAAAHAAEWSARQFDDGALAQTRSYLDADTVDWRNDAVFFFDFAMLLRGLCAAAQANLIALPHGVVRRLIEELDKFAGVDGEVRAARLINAGAALPARWSTIGGPFEVKACSRVLLAGRQAELPAKLSAACKRLIDRYAPHTATLALEMLHPTLYFAEGMLLARPGLAGEVAGLLARVLRLQRDDGSLPEAEHGSDLPRSDIIAQALRIGLQLRAQSAERAPDDRALGLLAGALLSRVGADGSVTFRNDVADREPNVWCSMFAEQALRWYAQWCEGATLPAVEWLV